MSRQPADLPTPPPLSNACLALPPTDRHPRALTPRPGQADIRRRASLSLISGGALFAAGCGGGGGGGSGDNDTAVSPSPPAPGTPSDAGTRSPDAAPISGSFGGGQGRIVWVLGVRNDAICEINLSTRVVSRLVELPGVRLKILGGVTRAANGRLAVLVDTGTLDAPVQVRIYEPNGAQAFSHAGYFWGIHAKDGAAISPNGQYVAIVGIAPFDTSFQTDALTFVLIEVETGQRRVMAVEIADELGDLSPTLAWTPDNRLLLLTVNSLYEIDATTAEAVRRHAVDLAGPSAAMVTADGRELWFHQGRGNQYGGTIWSLDIASGEVRRRSLRSTGWGQHAPGISPDGQWMLGSEGVSRTDGASVFLSFYVTAVRLTDPPVDVAGLPDEVLDATGGKLQGTQRMAWY